MKLSSSGFLRSVWLPLLFGAYPVLALLANNLGEIRISAAARALFVVVGAALFLWLVLGVLLRDWQRAGILCALLLILFFSYGHIYSYLENNALGGFMLGRHRLLVPVWLLIAAGLAWWAARGLRNIRTALTAFYMVGAVLLVLPLAQLVSFEIRTAAASSAPGPVSAGSTDLHYTRGPVPPDIYYIILDAYSRADILENELGFPNDHFLGQLEQLGFTVARCSQSNYAQTELSLASSLNFDYLQTLVPGLDNESQDRSPLWPLLNQNRARRILEENGYTVVAFETGYAWSELLDVDIYLGPEQKGAAGLQMSTGMNDFEVMLAKTSGALALADMSSLLPEFFTPNLDQPKSRKRERILFTLRNLQSLPSRVQGPKFVFAHIVAPHEPYVLGPQGEQVVYPEKIDPATYREAYTGQVAFLNQAMIPLLRAILEESDAPPIIVIQADHGHDRAAASSRMKILNAYFLPNGGEQDVYQTISPVNTFRVIFNTYFGGEFEILADQSYFSSYDRPFSFQAIPLSSGECYSGE